MIPPAPHYEPESEPENPGQTFSRWFTTWPSTHERAGQTVEVIAVEALADPLPAPVHRVEGKGSEIPRPPFRTPCQRCGALIPAWGVCPNPKCPGKRP